LFFVWQFHMKSTQSCSHVIIEIYTNICGPFVFATTEAGDWIIFSIYMWLLFVILGSPEIDTSIYANLETCLIRIKSCGFGFHEECHNMAQRRAKHECQMRWTSNRYSTLSLCSLLNILWTDQTPSRNFRTTLVAARLSNAKFCINLKAIIINERRWRNVFGARVVRWVNNSNWKRQFVCGGQRETKGIADRQKHSI